MSGAPSRAGAGGADGTGPVVVPASPERWDDLVTVFGTRGDPASCWCQFFLTTGRAYEESAGANRAALCAQVRGAAVPPGLIAYLDGEPVGWLQLGPRADFPRLPDPVAPVGGLWRITCFVVRVGHRRGGVASALLDAAPGFARQHGALVLEGNPVDTRGGRRPGANLFHGTRGMFAAAGFSEIARLRPDRPLMRLLL
jgi:GNAT superfamily N-acetyltransferase